MNKGVEPSGTQEGRRCGQAILMFEDVFLVVLTGVIYSTIQFQGVNNLKKLPTLLLTLFLFSSAYADERMSKDNLLKQWEGSVVSMTGLYDKPISFKVSNGELTYIKNSNSSATDAWIRDNGKLCIEYRHQDDCHRVIKTSEGVFTVKGLASTQSFRQGASATYKKRILTLSSEVREVLSEQITFKNTIAYANGKPYTGRVIEYKDGKRFLEYGYKNGIQEGLETEWHTKTGTKQHESYWISGKKEGIYISYWPNGNKRRSVNYINDVKEGLLTRWYKDGQLDYQQNYSGGTRLGSQFTPAPAKPTKKSLSSFKSPTKTNSTQFKKLSKQEIFKTFSGKIISFDVIFKDYNDKQKYPICVKIAEDQTIEALESGEYKSNNDTTIDCNKIMVKSAWVEYMSGKLCIETHRADKCKRIRRFSGDKYKHGFSSISIHSKLKPLFQLSHKTKANDNAVISVFYGPNSIKTTIYRDGGVAEETETIFKENPKPNKYDWNDKQLARYEELLNSPPDISKLLPNELALHPYLERKYEQQLTQAIIQFRSKDKDERAQGFSKLKAFARAGSAEAYIALLFDKKSIEQLNTNKDADKTLEFYDSMLFGNLFNTFADRKKIKIPKLLPKMIDLNPNKNKDQKELFRKLLILSQLKFTHYTWLISRGSDEMLPLAFKVFSSLTINDSLSEYQLISRVPKSNLKPIRKYLDNNKDVLKNLDDLAKNKDQLALIVLMDLYHISPSKPTTAPVRITKPDRMKAEFFARLALNTLDKGERAARKTAYLILEELNVKDFKTEIGLRRGLEKLAKDLAEKEVYEEGRYCTVALLDKDPDKYSVYKYDSTEKCLEKIKEASEGEYLDQGRFKNGNNPLIFWGPKGTYNGTLKLMKSHKPLNE